jgi:hypothetical protein
MPYEALNAAQMRHNLAALKKLKISYPDSCGETDDH